MPDDLLLASTDPHLHTLLDVRDVVVQYRARHRFVQRSPVLTAVDGVNLQVDRGEVVGLVGETGCGKSTLAKAILALIPLQDGRVVFDGDDVHAASGATRRNLHRSMSMVFQDSRLSLNPRRTCGQIVAEPLQIHGVARGQRLVDHVVWLLEQVGLTPADVQRYPHELSGGQRQRVGIARAIALEPRLIICDEPTSALDVSVQAQVLNLLLELRDRLNLSYLFISHDLAVVRRISDRVAVMHAGRIVEIGPAGDVFTAPQHPYTARLCHACRRSAVPPDVAPDAALPGFAPD